MPETKVVGGLKWVKGELLESLRRVRGQLDAFVAGGSKADCGEAITALFEVRGVLSALQMTAPARVTEEMQRLLERLAAGNLANPGEAAEALMLALVQLPHYLDQVDAGRGESPVTLLPSINDLRVSRGTRPLSAAELVVPSSVLAELETPTPETLKALASVAAKVRPHFHRYLLLAFQPDGEHGLGGLGRLFNQMHRFFRDGVFCDAFRAAEALTAGILDGGIPVTPAAKAALGHVDSVFKPLLQPEPAWPEVEARYLIGELLTFLADLDPDSSLVRDLEAEYRSKPDAGDGKQAPPAMGRSALGAEAMASLTAEVLRELASVRDRFDLFVRSGGAATDQLAPMEANLHQLANTMAIGEDSALVSQFHRLADALGQLVRGDLGGSDAIYLEFAQGLLALEDALRQAAPGDETAPVGGEAMLAALHEARIDLGKARQAIAEYALDPGDLRRLRDAPDTLPGVAAALHMVGDDAAAEVVDGIVAVLRQRFIEGGRGPQAGDLDLLAEAIAGVEMHMEDLGQGAPFGEEVLALAHAAMEHLAAGPAESPTVAASGLGVAAEVFDHHAIETDGLWAAEAQSSPRSEVELEPTPEPTPVETPLPAPQVDPEFLEIFLDEAREEHGRIVEALGRWVADAADGEALAILRRSFHTLKGSGRLVGATRVADLAAVTENVLNRVLGGELTVTPSVLDYLTEAAGHLTALIDAEAASAQIDTVPLLARARGLLGTTQTAPPVPVAVEEVWEADAELLEIFVAEAREHLTTLTDFLAMASRDEGLVPKTEVVRALHTLCGSARMTGVESIAAAGGALERLCGAFRERDMVADGALRDLLARVGDGIAERLEHLPEAGPEVSALAQVAAEATAWTAHLTAAVAVPVRSPEDGLAAQPEAVPQAPGAGTLIDLDLEPAAEPWFASASDIAPWPEEAPASADAEAPAPEARPLGPASEDFLWPAPDLEHELPPVAGAALSAAAADVDGFAPAREPAAEPVNYPGAASEPEHLTEPLPLPAEAPEVALVETPTFPVPGEEPIADAALTALFLEDARDILDRIDGRLRDWQFAPEHREPLDAIQRLLHTLKGSARLSGLPAIGDLSHALESTLSAIARGDMAVSDDALELAQRSLDMLSSQVDAVEQGAPVPLADDLVVALSRTQEGEAAEGAVARLAPAVEPTAGAAAPVTAAPGRPGAAVAQIRVRGDLLNRLVNNSGEISIYRARLAQQNGTLGFGLAELDQTVGRLREQLRQLDIETEAQILYRYDREAAESDPVLSDFDPLELDRFSTLQQLSRGITETVNDLVSVKNLLADIQRESADLLVQQARISDDLQDGLLRTRMVPFVQMVPRLHRLVRQTAQTLDKRANLVVRGPEVELDRSILDRLGAPLEHLLRNAVAHGIETPDGRRAAGKSADGVIELVLSREGNDVIIVLSDDGAGMDLAAIRRRAGERGLLPGGDVTDEELLQLAMEPGFSTVDQVTQIAGRGVGLDVVVTEVKRLSGSLALTSRQGQGTVFTLRLPLTLAIIDALLVTVGEATYAVPHASIQAVTRIPRADLDQCYSGLAQEFIHLGEDYRIMHLGGLLDPGAALDLGERRWLPLLLVHTADQRLALQIDSLIGTQRIVVKPLGRQLSGVRWLNGGTILPDGRVAMILDLLALARSPAVHAYGPARTQAPADDRQRACVMVVDDSLTVRRVTSRLLRRQNMDVMTARDGVEALALLEERVPDLILLDIEMPRMDGYELTRHIRRSQRLEAIPIIMITSRSGEKHRRTAMELGVNRYLGKPYQEAELLDEISAVLMDAPA